MADHKQKMREHLTTFLEQALSGSVPPSPSTLAYALVEKFAVIERGAIQFHQDSEWTGVYYHDKLAESPGDHYHADEWLQGLVGVVTVQDSPYLEDDRRTAAPDLARVRERAQELKDLEVAAVNAERDRLIAEIEAKTAEKLGNLTARY